MRIYEITGDVNGQRYAHFVKSQKEALKHKAKVAREADFSNLDIDEWEISQTKAGIVATLNDFILCTCFNDG